MKAPILALLLVLAAALPARAENTQPIRRFALVAGANDGGSGRIRLRYANSDAGAVARVLEELGGVSPGDRVLLVDPSRADLQRGLATMRDLLDRARRESARVELFVYYSGHSDEEGLLLGEERFGYAELRGALEDLPADVRVAILDSCSSGALTRNKGGQRRAPFLVDASSKVKGHAFLTSSSADEAAQESDRIGASFFTHFLVSGLRGAADTTRDGKVTLTEAYQFAFQETLARTEKTNAGAQHPAYEMQLAGTGDLVMTDLRSTAAGLVVERPVAGRIFVRDSRGALVVELRKTESAPVELGLAPGNYVVTVDDGRSLSEAQVQLAEGRRATLARSQLRHVEGERNVARGDGPTEPSYTRMPFRLAVVPDVATGGVPDEQAESAFTLNLLAGRTGKVNGLELGLGLNWAIDRVTGAQLSSFANFSQGTVSGAQLAAGANWSNGDAEGLQGAGGINLARGDLTGIQMAGGANWLQHDLRGLQLAGGVNVVGGEVRGLQAAPVNLAAKGGELLQVGVVNGLRGEATGLQLGGGVSYSESLTGAQISVVNIGGEVNGAQLGVVNIATGQVHGTQIGVFNYADDVDAPIGLVSVVRRGQFHLDLFADETNTANVAVKLGAKYVYGILTAGTAVQEGATGQLRWSTGLGLGGHIPVEQPWLSFTNVELLSRTLYDGDRLDKEGYEGLTTLRVYGGWELAPRFAIIAGPTLNVYASQNGDRGGLGIFGWSAVLGRGNDSVVRMWPGFFAGIQL